MKSDESLEFRWPDVGTIAVKPLGEWQASLRFFPSERAIAEGLLAASRCSRKDDRDEEGNGQEQATDSLYGDIRESWTRLRW